MEQTKNEFLSKKIIEYYNSISFLKFKDTEIGLIELLNSAEKEYDKLVNKEQKLVENILGENLNQKMTLAQRCSKKFFDIEEHIALFKEREHYREIVNEQSYVVGKRI